MILAAELKGIAAGLHGMFGIMSLCRADLQQQLVRSALGAKGLTGLALAMYVLPWVAWGAFQLCMYA